VRAQCYPPQSESASDTGRPRTSFPGPLEPPHTLRGQAQQTAASADETPSDFWRENIAGHAHDKEFSQSGVENPLRRNRESLQPTIVAHGCCPLARSASVTRSGPVLRVSLPEESLVSSNQPRERLISGRSRAFEKRFHARILCNRCQKTLSFMTDLP
jgi:hypothetical protein